MAGFELRDDVRRSRDPRDGGRASEPPFLVAREGGRNSYEPLKTRRLPQDFRSLAAYLEEEPLSGLISPRASERVISFADRYGFLEGGHPVLDQAGSVVGYGEALLDWLEKIAVFHGVVTVWDRASIASSGSELSRRNLEAVVPRADYGRRVDLGPAFEYLYPDDLRGRPLHEVVSERLRVFVSRQLEGSIYVALEPGRPLRFRPNSLLAAVYLDLALELVGGTGARLRECDYCHNQYLASRRDSRFCGVTCRSQARHVRNASRRNPRKEEAK